MRENIGVAGLATVPSAVHKTKSRVDSLQDSRATDIKISRSNQVLA